MSKICSDSVFFSIHVETSMLLNLLVCFENFSPFVALLHVYETSRDSIILDDESTIGSRVGCLKASLYIRVLFGFLPDLVLMDSDSESMDDLLLLDF